MVEEKQNKNIIPVVIAIVFVVSLTLAFGFYEYKKLQAEQAQNECQKKVSQNANVCNLKNNNMLFVGCNGFF